MHPRLWDMAAGNASLSAMAQANLRRAKKPTQGIPDAAKGRDPWLESLHLQGLPSY